MSRDVTDPLYTQLASTVFASLSAGIRLNKTNIRAFVAMFSRNAEVSEIAKTKEVVDDEAEPINYRPVDEIISKGLADNEQDAIDLDDDEHEEDDLNSDEHEELDVDNDEHDDLRSILKANDQALADAIKALKKARADIQRRLK
ncbi:hypothetical protein CPC16_002312 [Podila verticillata]|nr:hypothetical protein CPC16_002312 [Podila verticillata]